MPQGAKWILRAAVLLGFMLIRVWHLDADAPSWLSWSTGTLTDEGYYSLDARHTVLFGQIAPGNFHDSLLSPLLYEFERVWFGAFGTSLVALRSLSVAGSLASICLIWYIAHRRTDGLADTIAILYGLNPLSVFYSRLGLQESIAGMVVLLGIAIAIAIAMSPKPNMLLSFMSGVVGGCAIFVKSLAVLGLVWFLPFRTTTSDAKVDRWRFLMPCLGASMALLTYFLVWFGPHHVELLRMGKYYRIHQFAPHTIHSLLLNMVRALDNEQRGVVPYLLRTSPVLLVSAIACIISGVLRRSEADGLLKKFAAWLTMGLAFCFVSSYAPSRYYILFLPAMVFVGVSYISSFRSEWRNVAILASAFVCMAWDVCGLMNSTYSVSHAQATVRNNTRPGSTLIGEFGPELAIGSELRSAPVQPGLSNDMNPIEETGADYVAVTRNAYWQNWWHAHASGRISWNRPLFSVTLNGSSEYIVDVYEIRRLTESGLK